MWTKILVPVLLVALVASGGLVVTAGTSRSADAHGARACRNSDRDDDDRGDDERRWVAQAIQMEVPAVPRRRELGLQQLAEAPEALLGALPKGEVRRQQRAEVALPRPPARADCHVPAYSNGNSDAGCDSDAHFLTHSDSAANTVSIPNAITVAYADTITLAYTYTNSFPHSDAHGIPFTNTAAGPD